MSKRIKIQEPREDVLLRIENFYKRWDIQLSDAERWKNFRNRVLNSYTLTIGRNIKNYSGCEDEFFDLIGIHKRRIDNMILDICSWDNGFKDSATYNYFVDAIDIKNFILGLEVIFWMETLDKDDKTIFFKYLKDNIITTGVPLEVKQTKTDVLFYPAGAKLLDEKLVNDNLDWLTGYPKSYESFRGALQEFGTIGKERDVVDKLRLSLELLIRDILQNKKSLENQEKEIGNYLKTKNISVEISNMFWRILDYYNKYQNNKAKHENNTPSDEVEFILYLTGTFMRFLLTTK